MSSHKTFTDSYLKNLSLYVFTAIICGVIMGYYFPDLSRKLEIVSHYFFFILEALIIPVIFTAITYGISYIFKINNPIRIVGQMIIYFLSITSVSILLGLGFGCLLKPGSDDVIFLGNISQHLPQHFNALIGSSKQPLYANNHTLFLFVAILVGVRFNITKKKNSFLILIKKGMNVFYQLIKYFYIILPVVIFCNMAYGISVYGINTLLPLSKVVATVYLACIVFVLGILNIVGSLFKISIWDFLISIKEEIILVIGTSSSKTAFPIIFEKMEYQGYSPRIVRLIIPLGYTFNLAGACIYLSVCSVFLIQLYNIPMELKDYLLLFLIISIASKTASGVPGSGFLALIFTISRFGKIPMADIALLYSVDRFMNEARSVTNFIGIAFSAAIISKINKNGIGLIP